MNPRPAPPLVLVGVTASGKSSLAMAVARRHREVELVSMDSMQVYRGMDIGTAKPTPPERAEVRHHGIDLVDPSDDYTVRRFQEEVTGALADIARRGRRPLLVGGTGLYVRAVVDSLTVPGRYPAVRAALEEEDDTVRLHARLAQLDPLAASRMEPTNRRRVVRALEVGLGSGKPFSSFGSGLDDYPAAPFRQVGIALPRSVVDERIEARYEQQMADGFLDEVRRLAAWAGGLSHTARQALGYRELLAHLDGALSLDDALDLAIRRTRRFARRQERWFRRDPRITWLRADRNPMDCLDDLLGEFVSCA